MNEEEEDGWKAHSLGQPLPVDASLQFTTGWLRRKQAGRPILIYAAPGSDLEHMAIIADAIDL